MGFMGGLACGALVAWIVLLAAWGFFWLPAPRLTKRRDTQSSDPSGSPPVVAVVPARNERDVIESSLASLLQQTYGGPFRVILVDDRSSDGTADAARRAAARCGRSHRLSTVDGSELPAGWSGKVWAMQQGVAASTGASPTYLWFTDADITHDSWVLDALVDRAESERLDLVSTMATLRVGASWDRVLIPAFVYFFAKLYPFRFVSSPRHRRAGAAGGCMLVRRTALEKAGGLERIAAARIDDCALGRLVKRSGGRLWLGFCHGVRSMRRYDSLASVWDMVARSAYTQLHHSPVLVAGTIVGMLFLYAVPVFACVGGAVAAVAGVTGGVLLALLGAAAWGLMTGSFVPILHHHGVHWAFAPLLPVAGVLYTGMVLSSGWRHMRGRGGEWKGRVYDPEGGGSRTVKR